MTSTETHRSEEKEGRPAAQGFAGLIPVVATFVVSFLVIPGAAAGDLTWFMTRWSEAAFILVLLIRSILLSTQCEYDQAGPAASDHFRTLALMLILVVAVYDRTAAAAVDGPWWLSLLGIALCLAAGVLDVSAVSSFRRSQNPIFTPTEARRLETGGLYRYIRHPMYVALFLAAVGMPLILRSLWGAILALLAFVPLLAVRIRWEEARLTDHFGDEYRAYAARTKRFVPWIA